MDRIRTLETLLSKRFADRFWAKVERGPECWSWTGYRGRAGYGRISVIGYGRGGRAATMDAHRAAWAIENGWLPEPGEVVILTCRNHACVKPAHLRLGSAAGEKSATAKLTSAQVAMIRKCLAIFRVTSIARKFGVSHSLIQQIRDGKTRSGG